MKSLCKLLFVSMFAFTACQYSKSQEVISDIQIPAEFKSYWYSGEAEVSTYKLEQSRYGELRDGICTLIYVTEDFNSEKQVKADQASEENVSVLKLNTVKKFVTGIYPYSIMQSTFFPLEGKKKQSLKVSSSIQEWCGHVFMQLNNRDNFEIEGYSYFESEGDISKTIPKVTLENELWNILRINPTLLPTGDIKAIPSFEYLRLRHKPVKAYKAVAVIEKSDEMSTYNIQYPEIERNLRITFSNTFPYAILGWSEQNGIEPKTIAVKITSKKIPYWEKNGNKDLILRSELGLP